MLENNIFFAKSAIFLSAMFDLQKKCAMFDLQNKCAMFDL